MGIIRRGLSVANAFGVDVRRGAAAVRGMPLYLRNRRMFRAQMRSAGDDGMGWGKPYPCFADRYLPGGTASGHYFHMDLHVARLIASRSARRHVDVGSRVDGFVAHVASFREIEVLDIRKVDSRVENVVFHQHDLMQGPGRFRGACDSLSCLHALEHFGLGRYGDPVDCNGHLRGWEALTEMLEPGGRLYFAVPMGPSRVEFDAHRVFSVGYLLDRMIDSRFDVESFAYVNDAGDLVTNANVRSPEAAGDFGCRWGCAIFDLVLRG